MKYAASGAYEMIPEGIMKFDSGESSEMKSIRRIDFVEKNRTLKPKSGFFLVREAGLEPARA